MLKILSGTQVKNLDSNHIQKFGISSLELMEQAARGFVDWWVGKGFPKNDPVYVFCGAGNNGGDGFAIARLLYHSGFQVTVFTCFPDSATLSSDAQANFQAIPPEITVKNWTLFDPNFDGLIVDSFLGVGLKGELKSRAQLVIKKINEFKGSVISVDIPSGLPSDDLLTGICVKADFTVTFAFPKLSLLFPENGVNTGELVVVDIGIEDEEYHEFDSPYFFLRKNDVKPFHRRFHRFSHKGNFGKVLFAAGSPGKMGAVLLASKAALRTGSGLVTALTSKSEHHILQTAVPEVMCNFDLPNELLEFDSIGIGPGLGFEGKAELMRTLFMSYKKSMVIDADALTILGENLDLLPFIPKGSILTPHLKEFDRILGPTSNQKERLEKAEDFCRKWDLNLLIKGANSVICLSDGRQVFNSSGSKYMATAGSGDVLTGILTSFLGQGYSPEQAMICGVFQHGLAGEIAGRLKRRGTIASDIIEAIPETFVQLDVD